MCEPSKLAGAKEAHGKLANLVRLVGNIGGNVVRVAYLTWPPSKEEGMENNENTSMAKERVFVMQL